MNVAEQAQLPVLDCCPFCAGAARFIPLLPAGWTAVVHHGPACPIATLKATAVSDPVAFSERWNMRARPSPFPAADEAERVSRAIDPGWWQWFDREGDPANATHAGSRAWRIEIAIRAIATMRELAATEGQGNG